MCRAKKKIEELRKKKTLTKADQLALAEAQSDDYVAHQEEHQAMIARVEKMEKDLATVKEDVTGIKKDIASTREDIAEIKGRVETVVRYIESPAEGERMHGAYWRALATVTKSKVFWLVIIVLVFLIAMTGHEVKSLLGWLQPVVG